MIARNCPICHSESHTLHLEENFSIEKLNAFSFASRKEPEPFHLRLFLCKNCDLIYANPILDLEKIKKEYEAASFDSSIEAAFAAETYAKYLPKNLNAKSALDIGCGGGEFLLELQKRGIKNLCGVEPSKAAAHTAKPEIKDFIIEDFFDKKLFLKKRFDLISCFQTFEHVVDPLELSKDAYSLLNEEGKFFVVTHNFCGYVNKILGKKSPIYDIEHMQLFSPISLRKTLEKAGFSDIKIFWIVNKYPLFYWLKLLPKVPLKKQIINFSKKIKIGNLPLSFNVGNMAAIATK